ncbi:MAG: NADH-quinone oxidoreductase subunit L [Candidatus Dactylopiibacterium carminicum]|uniref:NADH-quinone oxidoreductase subunit L n=1 Tax=Candidatus Dactylopiibacterium carminicum TaxID=857335 RepID=A0A272EQ16_9RHOO|nr:NADH-quinone oxidoreductase subunit L [Candidatus Dactylopiibacterium carminicum]KAF7598419.1 NADH-quinone oxidoreductase subunit L [Candidatus Dactylopiibacterium carminicum]PAS92188.1 MAG: NADH-quinone oxidoreductase subunit L [Candidatus Dactylopiibacterium carminicum]PAS97653.1 MAG: NADH-quinone oxidoreductase subunit L [Candidatus Dactylopiibacterium carminicum]
MTPMQQLYLLVPLAPLAGAILAGLFGRRIGRTASHVVTILGVAVAFVASLFIYQDVAAGNVFEGALYTWGRVGDLAFEVGFLIDSLTVTMMLVVSFVSLMVHIYTIGYMKDDPGYQRFFSYISLFTFSMLMLVMSNNFLQLFFGWEAVGLVSYLLIGFWYERPSAIYANLKAFLVNRVGDFGFLLGIGLVAAFAGSLNYAEVFAMAPELLDLTVPATGWPLLTAICICLFIGAMGKSAQVPLHVWLPDSMEGPTPISALIHAATMVTAGIFMVARISPLFELSPTALSFVLVIGATTALFMGLLGIVQNDIKRVVAYSTLSQLGYMTVALGVSAYSAAVFHLMTHAFFKALLFLAAGSVIIGMHHDQDMRNMGGLRKYMPVTWLTSLIGSLALIGLPLFSGFYSKDAIIEAVRHSQIPGAGYAAFCVLAGVFITAFYSFRMYFLVFHGEERFGHAPHDHHEDAADGHHHGLAPGQKPHESPWVVTVPLILLAIPSVLIGFVTIEPMLFASWFDDVIAVLPAHDSLAGLREEFHGAFGMALHGLMTAPFWLAAAGVVSAWALYLRFPQIPARIRARVEPLYTLLENKYYFDRFNEVVLAGGSRWLGRSLWRGGDQLLIDGLLVNGSARVVGWVAQAARLLQSGLLYQYAFWVIIGLVILLALWWPALRLGALS